jgi:hypothetical protein
MRPVLVSNTPTGDGRAVLVWSLRPGWRVSVVVPTGDVTAADLDAMLAVILPNLTQKGAK